jgi:hypothetical protein
MTIGLQTLDQMMTNEPTRARYQNPRFVSHLRLLPQSKVCFCVSCC